MTITGHKNLTSLSSYIHEESFDKVQEKLNSDSDDNTKDQNTKSNLEKEIELLRLKLQLEQQKNETLQIQLHKDNTEYKPISLNTDQKGYA